MSMPHTNRGPVVLIDCDGVLVDMQDGNIRRLNNLCGTNYTAEDVKDFGYSNFPKPHREILKSFWYDCTYDDKHLSTEQQLIIDGLREYVRVVACSSPLPGHTDSKLRFLLRYFQRTDIALLSHKTLLNADLLIDDGPHNIEDAKRVGMPFIIFDQPYNRHLEGPRAKSFSDLGPLVLDILGVEE